MWSGRSFGGSQPAATKEKPSKPPLMSRYFQSPLRLQTQTQNDGPPSSSSDSVALSSSRRPVNNPLPPPPPPPAPTDALSRQQHEHEQQRYSNPQIMALPGPPPSVSSPPPHTAQNPLRIASFNPQDHPAMRASQTTQSPNTTVDTSKWGVRYNHGYSRSQDLRGNQTIPPRPLNLKQDQADRSSNPSTPPAHQDPKRKISQDGYKLPPIAYSPNPQADDDPWSRGEKVDEEEQDNTSPPPKPPKVPEQRSSQMPPAPPRLPLLYFEQDSVDQLDFAYQNPRPKSSHDDQTDYAGDRSSGSTTATTNGTERQGIPPPIDTSQGYGGKTTATHHGETVETPKQSHPGGEGVDGSNGSFFWHSPDPSSNGSSPRSQSPERTGDRLEYPKTSGNSFSSGPEQSLTSATALGFGAPSDWEHFGDYDAEEIDDIDLYTSNKPKTAELPANTSPVVKEKEGENQFEHGQDSAGLVREREILPTIQERTSGSSLEDDPFVEKATKHPDSKRESDASTTETESSSSSQEKGAQHEGSERTDTPDQIIVLPSITDGQRISPPLNHERVATPPADRRVTSPVPREITEIKEEAQRAGSRSGSPVVHLQSSNERLNKGGPGEAPPAPDGANRDSNTQSIGKAPESESILSSPIDGDDDGRENIIISLRMPDTPPPGPQQTPPTVQEPAVDKNLQGLTIAAAHFTAQGWPSPGVNTGRQSVFPQSVELEDPYAGLEPWAKASLNRYIKMLREESQASTEEEKYKVFVGFADKETRVRAILYDMDDESDLSDHPLRGKSVKAANAQASLRPMPKSKKLPDVPPKDIPVVPAIPAGIVAPKAGTPPPQVANAPKAPAQKKSAEKLSAAAAQIGLTERSVPQQGPSDESYVMVDTPAADPTVHVAKKGTKEKASAPTKVTPSLNSLKKALDVVASKAGAKDKEAKAKAAAEKENKGTSTPQGPGSLPISAPIPQDQSQTGSSDGDKPAYKPFKYNEGKPYEGDKAANRQSIYRPFSMLLRSTSVRHSAESSRRTSHVRKSVAGPHGELHDDVPGGKPPVRPVNYRYTILEPLMAVIPQAGVLHQEPRQLTMLRQNMDSIPDDFTFIHKTVLSWDAEAKKTRERYERERHARQGQNEQRIDALFNEHEIGYSDISQLEADFKRSESAKKAEEDREEVQTFVSSVFDVVWARINYEMDQLTPLYDECVKLVSEASAGREMFEDTEERVPIAPAMEILLILYQKLMVRHQKAFEAVLERDRRLKKTEVAPWYALGSIEKVKRIEKRFEDAEKKAILEFCRQRDERANLLMDVLDQNTLRGVGANQDYMESIMQAVRKIAMEAAMGGLSDDDVVSTDEVLKAKTITTALARSSEQIVQTFHVADMLLNAADYEVSVANAKLSNADSAAFKRLREAKAKEDSKLAMDLEHRMSLIRGDTMRTQEEVGKLMSLIGREGNGGISERDKERDEGKTEEEKREDREKEARLRAALEEAKRRNQQQGKG